MLTATLASPPAALGLAPQTLIDGRYILERELGRGAMGIVYRARDTGLDRPVAIKVIDPSLVRDKEILALFRREATALARVRSAHVIQIHSFGMHAGSPFFVMEFVEGPNLDDLIAQCRTSSAPIPFHRAATILTHCASGLGAVHDLGLVHRDVKPGNILVEEGTGRPVLIDFGLASPHGDVRTGFGTPHYMAPELWNDPLEASPASDVYAFGATAYELLTGTVPYDAETIHELKKLHAEAPVPRASTRRAAAAPLDDVIARALAKAPADRYPNATEFERALGAAARAVLPKGAPLGPSSPSLSGGYAVDALVIDDDETFLAFAERAIRIATKGLSIRVRKAASGEEALAAAREAMPDLVLLDFDMPGLNGLDTLSYLRAMPGGSQVRVMCATGSVARVGRAHFGLLGVGDFVAKPIAIRDLAARFEEMIRRG